MNVVPNANQSFDPSSLMNTNPTLSSPFPTAQQSWDVAMTPGMSGNIDWSQPAEVSMPQTLLSQYSNMGADTAGNGVGGGNVPGGMVAEGTGQENSDEYWNALIDGKSPRRYISKARTDVAGILGTQGPAVG